MSIKTVTIIGGGQVGTSIALALTLQKSPVEIHIYDVNPDVQKGIEDKFSEANLSTENIIFHNNVKEAAAQGDLVILATPINAFKNTIEDLKDVLKENAILTDTGSAKKMAIETITESLAGIKSLTCLRILEMEARAAVLPRPAPIIF